MKTLYFEKDFAKTLGNNGLLWAKNFDREIIWQQLHKIYSNAI
jgi:hypothetical protein